MQRYLIVSLLTFISLQFAMAQNTELNQFIDSVSNQFAPDKRVEVFNIKSTYRGDTLILNGETTNIEAYNIVLAQAEKFGKHLKDSVRLLPDKKLEGKVWGIIYNSVGTLRKEPRYSAELVSQALLGMPVKVLEAKGGWLRVQTPDKYIGWMNGSVKTMTEKELNSYMQLPKLIVTSLSTHSYSQPKSNSEIVSDLVVGDMLVLKDEVKDYFQVVYPDNREGYILKTEAMKVGAWLKSLNLSGDAIVSTAKQFMGVPYLWGGTSSKGLDCSGFTKTVYLMHGIQLARDASQQVNSGKLIDEQGSFDKCQPGDLVFFGSKSSEENPRERVVHVGIYIGNKRFIHASDYIHINSFDPTDELYDKYNTNRYLRTKRMIGEIEVFKSEEQIYNNLFSK